MIIDTLFHMEDVMRKRMLLGVLVISGALALILAFGGCKVFYTNTNPFGQVLDVKSGLGVGGLELRLVANSTGSTAGDDTKQITYEEYYVAYTTTTGEFDFSNETDSVPFGDYTVTVESTNYAFFDTTISITEYRQDLGTLSCIESSETGIALVLIWADDFDDVDAYITFPAEAVATTSGTAPTFTSPYDTAEGTTALAGFSPETFGTLSADEGAARQVVYYGVPSTADDSSRTWDATTFTNTLNHGTPEIDTDGDTVDDAYYISLDVDATLGSGPETITINEFPFNESATNTSTSGGGATGLAAGDYTWVGVMEYYADAYDSDWSDSSNDTSTEYLSEAGSGVSADAVLYIVDGSDVKGKYTVPTYTMVKSASLLRINCFYEGGFEYYQFVPDIRVLQSTAEVRSLGENGIITIRRNRGRS